jgi:hypothetical protein
MGTSEAHIQREIEREIGAEPDVLLIKNSVGRARFMDEASGKQYTVPFGLGVGSPDLVAQLRTPLGLAVWIGLEVKRPGEEPTTEQRKCHAQWSAFGTLVYVVRSVDDAKAAIADARLTVKRAITRERRIA